MNLKHEASVCADEHVYVEYTRLSQKFCNILAVFEAQFDSSEARRWLITPNYKEYELTWYSPCTYMCLRICGCILT